MENKYWNLCGNVHEAAQLWIYYILYYEYKFTKKKLINFNEILNYSVTEKDMISWFKKCKEHGCDIQFHIREIPARTKILAYNRKFRYNAKAESRAIDDAIGTMFMIATKVLHEHYRFSFRELNEFLYLVVDTSKDYSKNLKNPMKNGHMITFLDEYLDLPMLDAKGRKVKGIRDDNSEEIMCAVNDLSDLLFDVICIGEQETITIDDEITLKSYRNQIQHYHDLSEKSKKVRRLSNRVDGEILEILSRKKTL